MGCDIHVHIEVREKSTGIWHHLAAPRVSRSYVLFAIMAKCGRCGEVKPIASNRGLPDDITFVTRNDRERWGRDGHSDSWLGCDEIEILRSRLQAEIEHRGWKYDHLQHDLEWGIFHTYLHGNALTSLDDTGYDDVRLVFWFDN